MLSSTAAFAPGNHGDPLFFLKRQAQWLGVAIVVCLIASCVDHHLLQRRWWLLLGVSFVLLLLCFAPHIGMRHKGAARWVHFGSASLQDRKSTRLNSSHTVISYAVFCLKKKTRWRHRGSHPPGVTT